MGSTRLPNKILLPFDEEKTLLDFVLERLHKVPAVEVVIATTDNPSDDSLYSYLVEKGELVYRGSENDVLDRFICAAEYYGFDSIIRICSDNPFLDVESLIELRKVAEVSPDADYIGFQVNGTPSILTHFGFWGEYVTLDALKKVQRITDDNKAHEHVTYYIYTHPEIFDCQWLDTPDYLEGRDDIRLTIDTMKDLQIARNIHQELSVALDNYGLRDIVDYLNRHPDITDSMSKIIKENTKK